MPRKKKQPLSFTESMSRIANAKLTGNEPIEERDVGEEMSLDSLEQRVKKIFKLAENQKREGGRMLFFVMYDIESNKVRTLVSKYLIRNGCCRVQRSIFLADTKVETYERIKSDLAAVQAAYDNEDSIIILPVTTDYLRMMKVIGQKLDIDIITHGRNTLFF